MLNKGIETVTGIFETVVSKVEEYEPSTQQRDKVFGSDEKVVVVEGSNIQKLKVVSGDLLDIWLHEGSKGFKYLQESKAYTLTDPYVHYLDNYELVKSRSLEMGTRVSGTIKDLNQKLVLFVDEAQNFVGMLVKVMSQRQEELITYVRSTYSNVSVFVQENWMRLDFNADGSVTMDDLRTSLQQLYTFLKSYDYIEATTRIKSTLYSEAQKLYRESPK